MARWQLYDLLTIEWLIIGTAGIVLLAVLAVWAEDDEVEITSPWML